ncbi:MAG: class I SAM-dependent methyltransferase [Bdellovibrionales bacterium]|nr:class I SAM-dependent methyltransferase [Bdellovibrionales bacterium]
MEVAKTQTDVRCLSLRDPEGQLFNYEGRLLRYVHPHGAEALKRTLNSPTVIERTKNGSFIPSSYVKGEEENVLRSQTSGVSLSPDGLVLEHPRVRFQSFPHEWCPEMLLAAGRLTLDLAKELADEGLGLKDATPHNIQFEGPKPVFVDVLSVEQRADRDPTWIPFAQFVRNFVNPLLANKYFGLSLDMLFLTHRDGIEPEMLYQMASPLRRFARPFFSLVTVPTWLARRNKRYSPKAYEARLVDSPEKARFIFGTFIKHLSRALDAAAPKARKHSTWSDYMGADLPYAKEEFAEKEQVVSEYLQACQPKSLLDVGCNGGYFSRLATRHDASVVAIDYDPAVVGQTWNLAQQENLDILPLRVDLTRPTPSVGWKNSENSSFLSRSEGKFDTVMMLAVIHHMMVSEGIPLSEIVSLIAQLGPKSLILEYVDPQDDTFKQIARGRDSLYHYLSPESFERAFSQRFDIVKKTPLKRKTRCLYLLTLK